MTELPRCAGPRPSCRQRPRPHADLLGRRPRPDHAGRARRPGCCASRCYERKPLSYMTETAAGLLDRARRASAVFVPTTTRTREQYRRIHLPGPAAALRDLRERRPPARRRRGRPRLARAASRPRWPRVRAARRGARAPGAYGGPGLAAARSGSPRTSSPTSSSSAPCCPRSWVKELAAWAEPRGWTVSLQGRKIYAVPKPLTKSAAVRRGRPPHRRPDDRSRPATRCSTPTCCWPPTAAGARATANWPKRAGRRRVSRRLTGAGCAAGEEILRAVLLAAVG